MERNYRKDVTAGMREKEVRVIYYVGISEDKKGDEAFAALMEVKCISTKEEILCKC